MCNEAGLGLERPLYYPISQEIFFFKIYNILFLSHCLVSTRYYDVIIKGIILSQMNLMPTFQQISLNISANVVDIVAKNLAKLDQKYAESFLILKYFSYLFYENIIIKSKMFSKTHTSPLICTILFAQTFHFACV